MIPDNPRRRCKRVKVYVVQGFSESSWQRSAAGEWPIVPLSEEDYEEHTAAGAATGAGAGD